MTDTRIPAGAGPAKLAEAGAKTIPLDPTYEGDFVLDEDLLLDCGRTLAGVTLHYAVYGRLNAARDNAVLVCHALTGSALVGTWWPEIFAPGAVLSIKHDFVICINMLGSCYGSTGQARWTLKRERFTGRDFLLYRFETMCGRRRGCSILLAFAACGWFWRFHRRDAGSGLGHSQPKTRGTGADYRRCTGFGHGPGPQSSPAPGHRTRSGMGGRNYLPQRPPSTGWRWPARSACLAISPRCSSMSAAGAIPTAPAKTPGSG